MKKDFRLNYSIDDKKPDNKEDLYNIGGLLKPKIDYTVKPNETTDEAATQDNVGNAIADAASEKIGANLWDTVIKGV